MSQTEINTHLNVLHIDLNSNYDSATSSLQALQIMRSKFASQERWHYVSPTGVTPDLHHALLSKDLGGGIAYLGVLCNPNYGFGLSGSLSGNYRGMGNPLVWDMMVVSFDADGSVREHPLYPQCNSSQTIRVCLRACPPAPFKFMHELGHNFNSGHTHDGRYSPRVDTCGCPYSNGPDSCAGSCPSELPLAKSATLMSYCHLCPGNYGNIDYTFGGKYRGTGSRGAIGSYTNSPLAGTVSNEPRQVNVKMWNHVSSAGTCTEPHSIAVSMSPNLILSARMLDRAHPLTRPFFPLRRSQTPKPTSNPTSKPTLNPTPKPTPLPTSPPSATPTTAPMPTPTSLTGRPVSDNDGERRAHETLKSRKERCTCPT